MPLSRDSFYALLQHDKMVIENYITLKQRIKGLDNALKKVPHLRIKKEVTKEIEAYITLIELSIEEIDKGNRDFEKWFIKYINSIEKISDDMKEKLDKYRNKIGTMSYEETIYEMYNLLESLDT